MLLKTDFLKRWSVIRSIDDRKSGQAGNFAGSAQFEDVSDRRLHYKETGLLSFGAGPTMTATRGYYWDFEDDMVRVAFEDMRPFHQFHAKGLSNGTDHPCGDDQYTVAYDFTQWPIWVATWTVVGPRKDYTSVSTYSPD